MRTGLAPGRVTKTRPFSRLTVSPGMPMMRLMNGMPSVSRPEPWRLEDDHVAVVVAVEAGGELVDEDVLAVDDGRHHRALLDLERLGHEVVDDEVDQQGEDERLHDLERAAEGAARTGALARGGRAGGVAVFGDVRHRPGVRRGGPRQDSAPRDGRLGGAMGSLILARHAITEASAAGRNLGQRSDLPLAPMPAWSWPRSLGGAGRRARRAAARRAAAGHQPRAALPPDRGSRSRPRSASPRPASRWSRACSRSTTATGTASPPRSARRAIPSCGPPGRRTRTRPAARTVRAGADVAARAFAALDAGRGMARGRPGAVRRRRRATTTSTGCACARCSAGRCASIAPGCRRIRPATTSSASAAATPVVRR